MVKRKSWDEFRESGLLWFINTTLHAFGWAIAIEVDEEGKAVGAYPARVKFRGFSEESNTRGYQRVSNYLKENIVEIEKESRE